ncbi:MAG: hypothetical protein WC337_09295 [Candidatus Muiribacteriota bacterium]
MANNDYWNLRLKYEKYENFINQNKKYSLPEVRRIEFYLRHTERFFKSGNNERVRLYLDKTEFLYDKALFKIEIIEKEKEKILKVFNNYSYTLSENMEYLELSGDLTSFQDDYTNIKNYLNNYELTKAGKLLDKSYTELKKVIGKKIS